MIRRAARAQGFIDPFVIFSKLKRFSKPSEVWVPTELLRSGAVLQARGLMNTQAIQHNPDWVWPFWAERQFNPLDDAFIPRAFSLTHINLTHRNWTAVGLPDFHELPLVDPRGLVTPFFDGWSLDAWIVPESEPALLPSRLPAARQELVMDGSLSVITRSHQAGAALDSSVEVVDQMREKTCRVHYRASSATPALLVLTLRPYNPEGVNLVHHIECLPEGSGWLVNKKERLLFSRPPARFVFSDYSQGDVFDKLGLPEASGGVHCEVGMASAAALYSIRPGQALEIEATVPLGRTEHPTTWADNLKGRCRLEIPDERMQFLYEAAVHMMILHSPQDDVYPGPYTYKRFWFRDAAFILYAMLSVGLVERVEKVLDRFPSRQTALGYFQSQDGEWDSNGQALWILERFCRFTNREPKPRWLRAVLHAAYWIQRKRTSAAKKCPHAGLLPSGFSAEHLGPNDYYYWDDFWSIGGLRAAAFMAKAAGEGEKSKAFAVEARHLMLCTRRSLEGAALKLGHKAMPASPYRRMDAGAIGCLVPGYPLQLWRPRDERLLATAEFLLRECFLGGGFYQAINHSGINAYLSLHVAQILLRAQDPRYRDILEAIAGLATPTGQWPEAIHPRTKGGCMGDGQHMWAAAEWVLLMRNMFVREEETENRLVIGQGIPGDWTRAGTPLAMGPVWTQYGPVSVEIAPASAAGAARVSWKAVWHEKPAAIDVCLPGFEPATVPPEVTSVEVVRKK
ncbi:MAG: hypothetical protein A3D28_03865 [Omnitrophica bacterium RIFCSPHIGHO2_02_FULL_63_14]|nr:MAG: hypothetical protein A3D28_03865 [Omnitrophica bacterium RIFCSPHIGHO2_02_FULL_63_14]